MTDAIRAARAAAESDPLTEADPEARLLFDRPPARPTRCAACDTTAEPGPGWVKGRVPVCWACETQAVNHAVTEGRSPLRKDAADFKRQGSRMTHSQLKQWCADALAAW